MAGCEGGCKPPLAPLDLKEKKKNDMVAGAIKFEKKVRRAAQLGALRLRECAVGCSCCTQVVGGVTYRVGSLVTDKPAARGVAGRPRHADVHPILLLAPHRRRPSGSAEL